jgi:tetratricopeptide (TPR) repeat protein
VRLIAFALVAALASTAAADTPATPASAAPAPPEPDAAREHYERGLARYNLADFDGAILEFKQSYEISKAPRLLFNLAQAYRLKKDYESALFFYNTYLRTEPSAPNRDDVEAKIAEMKQALEEARKAQATPPRAQPRSEPPVDRVAEARTRRRRLLLGLGTAGAGLVVAGVGGGLLGLAAHDSSQLHQIAVNREAWTSASQARYDEGSRSQTAGVVLVAVGGAALVAGGVWALMTWRQHR